MQGLVEILGRLWRLFLVPFRAFSGEKRPSKAVLPVTVKKLVRKPEPISYQTNGSLGQGRSGLFFWFLNSVMEAHCCCLFFF